MKMSKLDRLGIEASKLGFGRMRLPMKGDAIDREQALAMFDYAYQHGVNYYDTAWPYLGGTSEPFVGEARAGIPGTASSWPPKCRSGWWNLKRISSGSSRNSWCV